MPLRDRTGPLGQGPRTGRGLGPCKVVGRKTTKGAPRLGLGRGFGRGAGRGRATRGRPGFGFGAGFGR